MGEEEAKIVKKMFLLFFLTKLPNISKFITQAKKYTSIPLPACATLKTEETSVDKLSLIKVKTYNHRNR